jgi:hypothetical protein
MTRKQDIEALLYSIQRQYEQIKKAYNNALWDKNISADLKVNVKNFFENARSVLDYLACDICEILNILSSKIYFPIVKKDGSKENFFGFVGRSLPNLESKNKPLFDYLESLQPYHSQMSWLGDFCEVSNNSKHQQLTPQKRQETVRITSKHIGGSFVSWDPASVRFGNGVFIQGAPVNPETQMPIKTPETAVTKEVWVSFLFMEKINALHLIEKVNEQLPKIVMEINELLK